MVWGGGKWRKKKSREEETKSLRHNKRTLLAQRTSTLVVCVCVCVVGRRGKIRGIDVGGWPCAKGRLRLRRNEIGRWRVREREEKCHKRIEKPRFGRTTSLLCQLDERPVLGYKYVRIKQFRAVGPSSTQKFLRAARNGFLEWT